MNFGFGIAMPSFLRPTSAPTEAQKQTVLAQGGAADGARDTVARKDGRQRAMSAVSAKVVSMKLPQKAAQVGKKKGA